MLTIVFASAHGSTEGIARRIGERIAAARRDVVVKSVDDASEADLAAADAVLMGSAIHNRQWLPVAQRFALENTGALAGKPVWLFSVGSIGDEESFFPRPIGRLIRKIQKEPPPVPALRKDVDVRAYRAFAGAIQTEDWGRVGTLFLHAFGGRTGDHRNWAAIDAWADEIAAQLHERTRGAVLAS